MIMGTIKDVEATEIQYALSLDAPTLLKILDKDTISEESLHEHLDKIEAIRDIDYNGHFGPYIYLKLSADHDDSATWCIIHKIIDEYVASA